MSKLDLVKTNLLRIIDNIDSGNSYFTDDECDQILDIVNKTVNTQNKLSKYQACKYLNVSRATFDNWVKDGKIPAGRKEAGFKEKFWLKDDLKRLKDKDKYVKNSNT